jgi:hypothetical protein
VIKWAAHSISIISMFLCWLNYTMIKFGYNARAHIKLLIHRKALNGNILTNLFLLCINITLLYERVKRLIFYYFTFTKIKLPFENVYSLNHCI